MEWEQQHGANIFAEPADPEMAEYLGKKNESLQNQVCSGQRWPVEECKHSHIWFSWAHSTVQPVRIEDWHRDV